MSRKGYIFAIFVKDIFYSLIIIYHIDEIVLTNTSILTTYYLCVINN